MTDLPRQRPNHRLFVDAPLGAGQPVALDRAAAHYLGTVLRLGPGAEVALFNGRDGEWLVRLTRVAKSGGEAEPLGQLRPQVAEPDLWLCFAPVKRTRIDLIAEKAGELGVSLIQPVFTRRTNVARVNGERLQANAREAAEQCERLSVPLVREPVDLAALIRDWPEGRRLLLCDESGAAPPAATALAAEREAAGPAGAWAVLIGPEGGFEPAELAAVRALPGALAVSLGPRILRADTAAIAALVLWQAHLGDWGQATGSRLNPT